MLLYVRWSVRASAAETGGQNALVHRAGGGEELKPRVVRVGGIVGRPARSAGRHVSERWLERRRRGLWLEGRCERWCVLLGEACWEMEGFR